MRNRITVVLWVLLLPAPPISAQSKAPPLVFKAEAALIHIDVVVSDKQGEPIPDLLPGDFELESDGRRYPARFALYVSAAGGVPFDLGDGAQLTAEDVRRTVTFLFAFPRITTMAGRPRAVRPRKPAGFELMLDEYVRKWRQPGDLVSIVSVESQRPLLNRLHADPESVKAAVASLEEEWIADKTPSLFVAPTHRDPVARYDVGVMRVAQEAVQRMAALPGRKLLILFAPTLNIVDEWWKPQQGFADVRKEAEELVRLCNEVGVTVHGPKTVSPGALPPPPPTLGPGPPMQSFTFPFPYVSTDAVAYLAEGTGGSTFSDRDSYSQGLERVLTRNRGYYLLGFDEGRALDDKPRRIKVRVRRAGAEVEVRPVVFPKQSAALLHPAPVTTLDGALDSALALGDLEVRVRVATEPGQGDAVTLRATATIGAGPAGASRDFDVLWRVLDERAVVIFTERTSTVSDVFGEAALTAAVSLPRAGFYQVDVAAQGVVGGRRGNASLLVKAPLSKGQDP